jgi:hypothetical protein
MNPPYGRTIKQWVRKLVDEYQTGTVTEAIALLPARTDTQWHLMLRDYPRCYLTGRLKFGEVTNSAPFPSMAVYLGPNVPKFVDGFRDVGDIYVRLSTEQERIVELTAERT